MSSKPEEQLASQTKEFFLSQGFGFCFEELPFLTRSIDLCFYDMYSNRIVSVELKVKEWRRALQQARVYQLCSDQAYVVMHPDYVHRADLERFQLFGVGLLAFGRGAPSHSPAAPSAVRKEKFRARILDLLMQKITDGKK